MPTTLLLALPDLKTYLHLCRLELNVLKFRFSKKAKKGQKHPVALTFIYLLIKRQINWENLANLCGLLRKPDMYTALQW